MRSQKRQSFSNLSVNLVNADGQKIQRFSLHHAAETAGKTDCRHRFRFPEHPGNGLSDLIAARKIAGNIERAEPAASHFQQPAGRHFTIDKTGLSPHSTFRRNVLRDIPQKKRLANAVGKFFNRRYAGTVATWNAPCGIANRQTITNCKLSAKMAGAFPFASIPRNVRRQRRTSASGTFKISPKSKSTNPSGRAPPFRKIIGRSKSMQNL